MTQIEKIALFDMDGTLFDHRGPLIRDLEYLRSPGEPEWTSDVIDDSPEYIKRRASLIRQSSEWWENLPKLQLGWDVLEIAKELEYRIMILTQGPRSNPSSWAGKKRCIDKNLGSDIDMTITRDKGLVYGTLLVDDFPPYAKRWLKWRKNGLVIMPASDENSGFSHSQVIRYDGSNLERVKEAMVKARRR